MPIESMVDALTQIKTFLKPQGILIDLHPLDARVPLFVQADNRRIPAGEIYEVTHDRYAKAELAVQTVLENQQYALERSDLIEFAVYHDSVATLRQYLDETWDGSEVSDETWELLKKGMSQPAAQKHITYTENIRLNRLLSLG